MTRRALIVCAAPQAGSRTHVARLAASADIVIAVDGGLEACRSASVTPNVIVGDLDSVTAEDLQWARAEGVEIEAFPADKDVTDLDLALRRAQHDGADEVVVTACTGARIDHALGVFGSLVRGSLPARISEPHLSAWLLAEGVRGDVSLAGMGATVSVIALAGSATVTCAGVRWPLVRAQLEPLGTHGISNVIVADPARVELHSGCVAVISSRVDGVEPAAEAP